MSGKNQENILNAKIKDRFFRLTQKKVVAIFSFSKMLALTL